MSERDPGELADSLEQEADELEQHSDRLGDEVQDARQDWQQKRSDPSVPGANPPESDDSAQAEQSPDREAPTEDEGRG
jgi:hypothetical protein